MLNVIHNYQRYEYSLHNDKFVSEKLNMWHAFDDTKKCKKKTMLHIQEAYNDIYSFFFRRKGFFFSISNFKLKIFLFL